MGGGGGSGSEERRLPSLGRRTAMEVFKVTATTPVGGIIFWRHNGLLTVCDEEQGDAVGRE